MRPDSGCGAAAGGSAGALPGRLISVEGIDAVGKTTQARRIADALGADLTFQFGATDVGAAIRGILLDPGNSDLDHRAEALLVIADKAQHVAEAVRPSLRCGRDVVTDRYTASTLAYQGYGRCLDIGMLQTMLDFATGGLSPDLTVLLDIDPAVARSRLEPGSDRFEDAIAEPSFAERVRRGYLELADTEADCWVVVDAHGSVDEVAASVDEAVRERLHSMRAAFGRAEVAASVDEAVRERLP